MSSAEIIIGIDPGLNGGITVLENGDLIFVQDMPVLPLEKGKKIIDTLAVYNILVTHIRGINNEAAIESVHAMPGQGVTSMFNFGLGYGLVRGAIDCAGYLPVLISPQKWKKHFNLINKDKKDGLVEIERLWPDKVDLFKTKRGRVLDGRVDAALIGRYYFDVTRRVFI